MPGAVGGGATARDGTSGHADDMATIAFAPAPARASPLRTSEPGRPAPLGASLNDGGVNFSVFSKHAAAIELLLFDDVGQAEPARVVRFDPVVNRSYHDWHVFVPGLKPGQLYGYRADGPFDPERGLRFDFEKVLLDSYGRGVAVPAHYSREAARRPGNNTATAMKSVVVDPSTYD
ncbi:hypothetical protein [Microvirga subterranea]|uniref:Putative carbohydrate-binding protein with CBM48 n=1 Tax=Microvirga subterranea TaxID=186651 RepID=A0A370HH62_9HYPH|nr:hypothetical protein [Microvirga subterranea]RDI57238.1 putative carbohydrate-binding protein with CBM48 [Microvirga subterranea]